MFKLAEFFTKLTKFWEIIGRGPLDNFGNSDKAAMLSDFTCIHPRWIIIILNIRMSAKSLPLTGRLVVRLEMYWTPVM